jgi:predicted HAD superfamily Cof-like phosphohydrolase
MDMPQYTISESTPIQQRYHRLPPVSAVREFMRIGGQTTNEFNPQQATMYIGLMCEELAETLRVVAEGGVDTNGKSELTDVAERLESLSMALRQGFYMGNVIRSTHTDLLDGMIDAAWVAFGGALSVSINAVAAWNEVARANFDKYPGGKATRDSGGKVLKPAGWRGPDLLPFVAQLNDKG